MMIILIIVCSVIMKDKMLDLFTIGGEDFSIRGEKNSSESHQVFF